MNRLSFAYGNQTVPSYINWHCNKKKLTRKHFRHLVQHMKNYFISDIFMNLALMKTKFVWFYCMLFTDEADSLSKEENNFFLTLIKRYFCSQFYNYMYTCYLEIIKWTKILGQENKQDWIYLYNIPTRIFYWSLLEK
jgi:hypothetical protein